MNAVNQITRKHVILTGSIGAIVCPIVSGFAFQTGLNPIGWGFIVSTFIFMAIGLLGYLETDTGQLTILYRQKYTPA